VAGKGAGKYGEAENMKERGGDLGAVNERYGCFIAIILTL